MILRAHFTDESDSKPEIIKHPGAHKVLLGQNVSLQCIVSQKNHSITVNWTKNNKPLTGAYVITHAQVMPNQLSMFIVCAPRFCDTNFN